MPIKTGKTEVEKMLKVLDEKHETMRDAAVAVLAAAVQIVEDRAKFVVVGQIKWDQTLEGGYADLEQRKASKVCLGFFSTAGDARAAAESLVYSSQTHEEALAWTLPVAHESAASWYAKRKAANEKARDEAQAAAAAKRKAEAEAMFTRRAAEVTAEWDDRYFDGSAVLGTAWEGLARA